MDRRTLESGVLAGLGTLGLALAAATLTTTVSPHRDVGTGGFDGGTGGFSPPTLGERPLDVVRVPWLSELLTAVMVLVAVAVVAYAVLFWREVLPRVVALLVLAGALWLLVAAFGPFEEPPGAVPMEGANGTFGGEPGSGEAAGMPAAFVIAGLGVLGALAVALWSSLDRGGSVPEGNEASTETRAVGAAAGRAADRIADDAGGDDVDNEVYRAWREMTSHLEVSDPGATTPRGFASAAVDAGMDPGDVDELTRLFEDVRYGDVQPTQDREQRAIRVLRRIEREYASAEA